jgi:2-deoxy-D-gluconate 3-dehydrogenase
MPSINPFDLSGRVAVVTGGNRGIGRGIALGLAQARAAVAILARNEEKNRRVMGEFEQLGVAVLAVKVNVASRGELQPALAKVEETLGPISILVNNAGITVIGGVLDQAPGDWDQVIETNLNACFLLSKLAAQSMDHFARAERLPEVASRHARSRCHSSPWRPGQGCASWDFRTRGIKQNHR